jgi:hypothetical protein
MRKLAKKAMGGVNTSPAKSTKTEAPAKKKVVTDVARNPQYKSTGVLNTEGKMVYQRKKGSGASKAPEGTSAPANFKKGGSKTAFDKYKSKKK